LLRVVLKREEAITVLKELLDTCRGLDGHSLELALPNAPTATVAGYKIIIRGILDSETKKRVQDIIVKHQLTCQVGSMWKTKRTLNKEPDTLIIYKPHDKALAVGNP
jgi:hypothetical protein